ncbi:MAG TPA: hypothetical protein VM097_13710 [Mycobacteriales bacterium]|nr:hypothetical protein [Mycobacteriales bacterium]
MLSLIDFLRELDARFVAAVTANHPPTDRETRLASALGALGLALVVVAAVLLPPHGVIQTTLVGVGLLLAVPSLHHLFDKVLLSVR